MGQENVQAKDVKTTGPMLGALRLQEPQKVQVPVLGHLFPCQPDVSHNVAVSKLNLVVLTFVQLTATLVKT